MSVPNNPAIRSDRKSIDWEVPQWALEKYAGQHVAVTRDGSIIAAAPTGRELIQLLDHEGHDRRSYCITKIYSGDSFLVL